MPRVRFLLAGGLALLSALPAGAADYPTKPIEMIVAFAPGGGTDVAARSIAQFIEKHLGGGARVGVINRPGAGGEIGWTAVAQAAPDGYTIGFLNAPAIVAMTIEKPDIRFKMDSFQPIANLVYDPGIFAVHKDSELKSLPEAVEFAKKSPGALTVGTTGAVGSSEHLAILALERASGAKFNHAPFGGTAPMRAALLGRHIPLGAFNLSEAVTLEKEGQIRILGVMAEGRSPMAPNVPTFREQGFELVTGASRGIGAPKGIPPEVLQKLSDAVQKAVNDPEYVAAAQKAIIPLDYKGPAEYGAMIKAMEQQISGIWKNTPWK